MTDTLNSTRDLKGFGRKKKLSVDELQQEEVNAVLRKLNY